jgi:hypothetical protein
LTGCSAPTASSRGNSASSETGAEVLHRIVGQLGVDGGIDGHRPARRDQQRVAVGRRLGDDLGGDDRLRARLVVDHDRLAELVLQLGRDDARDQVVAAAGE